MASALRTAWRVTPRRRASFDSELPRMRNWYLIHSLRCTGSLGMESMSGPVDMETDDSALYVAMSMQPGPSHDIAGKPGGNGTEMGGE